MHPPPQCSSRAWAAPGRSNGPGAAGPSTAPSGRPLSVPPSKPGCRPASPPETSTADRLGPGFSPSPQRSCPHRSAGVPGALFHRAPLALRLRAPSSHIPRASTASQVPCLHQAPPQQSRAPAYGRAVHLPLHRARSPHGPQLPAWPPAASGSGRNQPSPQPPPVCPPCTLATPARPPSPLPAPTTHRPHADHTRWQMSCKAKGFALWNSGRGTLEPHPQQHPQCPAPGASCATQAAQTPPSTLIQRLPGLGHFHLT